MKAKIALFALLFAAAVIFSGCIRQTEGTLQMTVFEQQVDAYGNATVSPVQNAQVLIENQQISGQTNSLTTDANGKASIQLIPGTYRITITKQNYQTYAESNIPIAPNSTTAKSIRLDRNTSANSGSEFGKLISGGNPKEKINFIFIANNFSRASRQKFLDLANEIVFGKPNDEQKALFRDYLYKDEKDKFNVYYYMKYDANYGGKPEFTGEGRLAGERAAYGEIYSDLNGILDNGANVKEEIDQFIVLTNGEGRPTSIFWPAASVLNYYDDVLKRTNLILLFVDINDSTGKYSSVSRTLAHELGHTIGTFGDEYYEESKGWFYPDLSSRINADRIGCPKWCSGTVDTTTECYAKYSSYLACIKDLNDYSAQRQQYLDCYSASDQNRLWECNFGTSCQLDTGCYWPMQGTLGFKAYQNSIMKSGDNYGQWQEQVIRQKIQNIKPAIRQLSAEFSQPITFVRSQNENSVFYDFSIPFSLSSNNSSPFTFLLNGRNYTLGLDINTGSSSASPVERAQILFNRDFNGYVAKLRITKPAKENTELTEADRHPARFFAQYGDLKVEREFTINFKDRRIE